MVEVWTKTLPKYKDRMEAMNFPPNVHQAWVEADKLSLVPMTGQAQVGKNFSDKQPVYKWDDVGH